MPLAEVYCSANLADCDERALLLYTQGIGSEIVAREESFALLVAVESAALAADHLRRERAERPPSESMVAQVLHQNAWVAVLAYSAVILGIAYLAGTDSGGVNWIDAGALRASAVKSEQWWRLVTALTLHADGMHLLGNLIFGALFSYFAAQLLGSGVAALTILLAAAIGNLLNALVMPVTQVTIGASTAVFAALGVISAYSWRQKNTRRLRWVRRFGPLVGGVVLLAMLGTGDERTDVVAHLTGFSAGIIAGSVHAHIAEVKQIALRNAYVQSAAAAVSLLVIVAAWSCAL
ncbi:MAG: rhomboid family intramembrane serine protease [Candidatus Obscuribacterales bacterium]|nr:rhomboid family intramembrane serine protease [Steroidobacteraceae bacterium]